MDLLKFLRHDDDERRTRDRRDDDPEVDHQMILELGKVTSDEMHDLPTHAGLCALRFKLLAAMGVTNNRQSRENARKLDSARRALTRYIVAIGFALAVIDLFGKEKGTAILLKVAAVFFG